MKLGKNTIFTGLALCLLFNVSSLSGQTPEKVSIDSLQAMIQQSQTPVIVNFWATWCGPCVEEIGYFESQARKNKDKGVELWLVSLDAKVAFPGKIAEFAKKRKLGSRILWLNETNADHFCPIIDSSWSGSIPSTLFVNNPRGYHLFKEGQVSSSTLSMIIAEMVK